jgi:hypothetical protein
MVTFPSINDRLAWLVSEVMELPYLIPVFVVWACFGVHLVGFNQSVLDLFYAPQVEPFYAKTISKDSTHSSLKVFFKNLYKSMDKDVTDNFFNFNKPEYDRVCQELLNGVKESYGIEVLNNVAKLAEE